MASTLPRDWPDATDEMLDKAIADEEALDNPSRIYPMEYKILVRPEDLEETDPVLKAAKEAGIELPDNLKEREQMMQGEADLIAVGGNAFEDWNGKPKVGDRVLIAKYAGIITNGKDGVEYRLCNDKDVAAVIR